jgi:hypothetical protein
MCNCNNSDYSCSGQYTSSNCVIWEGDDIPVFGICTGDPITFVEQQIINQINLILASQDTSLSNFDLDSCPALKTLLANKDVTYANLIDVLWRNNCTLKQLIDGLQSQVTALVPQPYPFDLKCIVSAGTPVTRDTIVQGLINKVCSLETSINNIVPNIDTLINTKVEEILTSALLGLGNRGIKKLGSGSALQFLFYSFVPKRTALPYYGDLANFDGSGMGIVGTDVEGWFLLNGNNNMPDGRGRTLVGAVAGIPGPALDSAVDPSNPDNPDGNYNPGDKFGSNWERLTLFQIPPHTHPLVDPGHFHTVMLGTRQANRCSESNCGRLEGTSAVNTSTSTTGITIGTTGGGDIHNNRQPSLAITGYIMRID